MRSRTGEKLTVAQQAAQKLRKLCQMVADLKRGEDFSITRLTVIKNLCPDIKTAARFAAHLAALAQRRKDFDSRYIHFKPAEKRRHQQLAAESLTQIGHFLQRRTASRRHDLFKLLSEARAVNNVYRNIPYGVVREIQSMRVLMIEKALQCALASDEVAAAYWAYQAARDYAEKYDPRYGTGLIPESAPLLEEITDFWCQHYFGRSSANWFAAQPIFKLGAR